MEKASNPSEDGEALPKMQLVGVPGVPGVVSMIGISVHPAPLANSEAEALRKGLDPMRIEPHPIGLARQRVRIHRLALAGIEGRVVRKKSEYRVVLTLNLLTQSTAIEVHCADVRPVDRSFKPMLEAADKEIEKRASLYQFHCLDFDSESTQVAVAAAIGHSDA